MLSRYVFQASFYTTLAIGAVMAAAWPWQGFVAFMQTRRIPFTFLVVASGLLIMHTYLHSRIGRAEIAVEHYFTRDIIHQHHLPNEIHEAFWRYGFPRALVQILGMLLPVLPFLLLAMVVSGFSLITLSKALAVILTASLFCRLSGFLVYQFCGNNSLLGYFVLRVWLAGAIYASGFLNFSLNPLGVLYNLESEAELSKPLFMQAWTLYMGIAVLGIIALALLCEWRGRHLRWKNANASH